MKIGDNVVLRGTIKGVTYGEFGSPYYLVTLPNGCETEFPKPYIEDLQQLDEPEKAKVPQVVAEKIEYFKKSGDWDLFQAMDYMFEEKEIKEWLEDKDNQETFARAWLDGYDVEEERRYYVKITAAEQYLVRVEDENFLGFLQSRLRSKFTRKQLEEAGFGWVFDCEGIEIEEVE